MPLFPLLNLFWLKLLDTVSQEYFVRLKAFSNLNILSVCKLLWARVIFFPSSSVLQDNYLENLNVFVKAEISWVWPETLQCWLLQAGMCCCGNPQIGISFAELTFAGISELLFCQSKIHNTPISYLHDSIVKYSKVLCRPHLHFACQSVVLLNPALLCGIPNMC